MKKLLVAALAALLVVGLWGCKKDDATPSTPVESESNINAGITQLTTVVTDQTIASLEDYPDLEKADLTGSTCYAAIADYIARHPEVEVIYTVDLGGTICPHDTQTLTLEPGSYDPEALAANIRYLPKLTALDLPGTTLSGTQLAALKASCPDLALTYSLSLNGSEVALSTTELDLSWLDSAGIQEAATVLSLLPDLKSINLMDESGACALALTDVATLAAAAPQAKLTYSFSFYGLDLTADSTTVSLKDTAIGDENEDIVRALLTVLDCTELVLDGCGLSDGVMADIRNDFPNTQVVWRVWAGTKSWLTNTDTVSAIGKLDDASAANLAYLTAVRYLDLSQCAGLTDISFVKAMPALEIAIFSESGVSDLSPLAACPKLECLELVGCKSLSDLSPLAKCTNLKYLNIGHTAVKDLTVLKSLPLELLSYVNSGLTAEAFAGISGTVTYEPLNSSSANAYDQGWHYSSGTTYTEIYKKIRSVFGYDNQSTNPSNPLTGDDAVKKVTLVVTASSISQLEKYKNLEEANLSGSTCYDAILEYMAKHPEVDVTFTVPLGGKTVKNTSTSLTLSGGDYTYETLLANLKYVTSLKNLTFPSTSLTTDQLGALKAAAPGVTVRYTMRPQSTVIDGSASAVDLSAITAADIDSVIAQLGANPNVAWVELMSEAGTSSLSISDVKKLQDGAPNVIFHYSFTLGGKTVSTTDERIEFVGYTLNGIGEQNLRNALDILSGCTYFLLDNNTAAINNATMASIRDAYPDIKIVWRIYHDAINTWDLKKNRMQKDSLLTDTEVLRAVYGVTDSNSAVFRYLTDVKYVDLGHDTEMHDISFLGYMPKLEIAILSGSPITDLSPLANCKKLEFLEIAWCGHVRDISPLSQCDSLKYLNISHTSVKDLTPLKGLNMQMLSYVNSGNRVGFTEADWNGIAAMLPDCWLTYNPLKNNNASPYGAGWRYKESGGYTPIYRKVRDVFGLDQMTS